MTDTSVVGDVARSELAVRYDGPAIADGRMDVRTLAPSLLGLADAVQAASRELNPGAPDVRLEIRATGEGSFRVFLDLARLADPQLLSGDTMTALANLKAVMFDPIAGLAVYLWHKRRNPSRQPEPDGSITYERQDGTRIVIPSDVRRVGDNVSVRASFSNALSPLAENVGVDTFEVDIGNNVPPLRLGAGDLASFEPSPDDDDPIEQNEYTAQLRIVTLSWDPDLSWRFDDGERRFPARIVDPDFYRTAGADAYRNGDRLRARVLRQQWDRGGTLSVQYQITKVLEHRQAPPPDVQLELGDITDEYDI